MNRRSFLKFLAAIPALKMKIQKGLGKVQLDNILFGRMIAD